MISRSMGQAEFTTDNHDQDNEHSDNTMTTVWSANGIDAQ